MNTTQSKANSIYPYSLSLTSFFILMTSEKQKLKNEMIIKKGSIYLVGFLKVKSNQIYIKSNQIKSNLYQIKSNLYQIKSNLYQIKSNQIKLNQIKSNLIKSNQT